MQNSLAYGADCANLVKKFVPTKEQEAPKKPAIRSKNTRKLTGKKAEYTQTERPEEYEVFIKVPLPKEKKRSTCIGHSESFDSIQHGSFTPQL